MPEQKQVRIGDLLIEYGYINEEQLHEALAYQKEHDTRLGRALIDLGFVTENEVQTAVSHKTGYPLVKIEDLPLKSEVVGMIPREMAEKNLAIAVNENDGVVNLVIYDPLDLFAVTEIEQVIGHPVNIMIGNREDILKNISHYYSEVEAYAAIDKAHDSSLMQAFAQIEEISTIDVGDDQTPVVNLLNSLILRGYNAGASDMHIEPFSEIAKVRMRVDGALIHFAEIPKSVHPAMIVRLKIMSNLDIAEKRLPQDGHFRVNTEGLDINIRISIIPTVYGEKAVLRFLATNSAIDHSEHFGMIDEDYEKFQRIMANPNGIIYITGPTGSGKTTTMYMALGRYHNLPVNISSIEDPVEKNLDSINQIQVNNMAGLTFEVGLRSLLRQDPDIIMVGETRDAETASISVSAAITGHLVMSTLHTNDALTSVVRLIDMGVPPYLVGNSIVGLVAQRLLRKVCPYCREEYEPSEIDTLVLGGTKEEIGKIARATGCYHCNETGYKGRIAIHEIVEVDKRMQRMIAEEVQISALYEYARKEKGMATLRERARSLVLEGVTSMEEFLKIGESVD